MPTMRVSPAECITDEDRVALRRHKEPLVAAMQADTRYVAARKRSVR